MVGLRIEADITDPSLLCPMVGPRIEADVTDPSVTPVSHGWLTH